MKRAIHLLNSIKKGGAENVAYNYSLALQNIGIHSVFVGEQKEVDYENMLLNKDIEVKRKLDRKLLEKTDYIFVHSNKNLLKLAVYKLLGRLRGKQVIYLQHLAFSERKFQILSFFINLICTDFILITPRTKALVEKYITVSVTELINFYVPRYDKKDYEMIRSTVRKEIGVGADVTIFMFSAIFRPGKGLGDCIELAKRFVGDKDKKFLIAGGGEEQYLLDNYPYDNIIAVGNVNDVERYLIASDVYLFLSVYSFEMLPMALQEAIATDLSVLAYKGIINDFLLQGKTCDSLEEMTDRIKANNIPRGFKHYNLEYAKHKFQGLLK